MKKKITILFVMALAYFIISSAFTENEENILRPHVPALKPGGLSGEPESKNFINCIFNSQYKPEEESLHVEYWLDKISDSLNFNTVQIYGEWGSLRYGQFQPPLTDQQKINMNSLMNGISSVGLSGLYGRVKIEKLCYGQRLIYEVSASGGNTTNDGFCYSVIPDSVSSLLSNDSGRTVRYCNPNTNKAGYICDSIYENFHHNDLYDFQTDILEWHMKPMMRIDTVDFSPTSNVPVVAIVAKSFADSTIDSVVIRVRHFKNEIGQYFGQYIEKFTFEEEQDSLSVSGDIDTGLGHGIRNGSYQVPYWNWNDSDYVDFEIYWFGQVKVWFDKMTVDDKYANKLFDPLDNYNSLIFDEVDAFTSHSSNLAFFADEITYANIPCIKYVKDKMLQYNSASKLTISTTNYLNVRSMRNDTLAHRKFLQTVQPYMFSTDIH